MLILAIVASSPQCEAAKTSIRYLKQRENDLRTIAENLQFVIILQPGLWPTDEAEVYRRAGALPETVC